MKVGFIGAGNMGSALLYAFAKCKDAKLYIFDIDEGKAKAVAEKTGAEVLCAQDVTKEVDFLFLAVKPHLLCDVLAPLAKYIQENKGLAVVSVAAGVTLDTIAAVTPEDTPIIRMMPNTPVAVGCGMTAYVKNARVSAEKEAQFLSLMEYTGKTVSLPEEYMDAESAIAGSGPAFAYMFIEALADGGVRSGLSRDGALLYAAKTLEGAARMFLETGKHPGVLKDEVCSPAGSTIEGVMALEEGAFRHAVSDAVFRTYQKAKILGKKEK